MDLAVQSNMNQDRKNRGFKVPEGYFEDKLGELKQPSRNETEFSQNIHSGFEVPKGYFENLPDIIFDKCVEPENQRTIPLRTLWYGAIAASLTLLIATGLYLRSVNQNTQFNSNIELTEAELQEYWDDYGISLSTWDLVEISESEGLVLEVNQDDEDLSEDALLNYLEGEIEDLEDLNISYEELQ